MTNEEKLKVADGLVQHFESMHPSLVQDAIEETERQKAMSVSEAVRLYPKAIMWSVILSTAIVMEGFDLVLIGSFFAFPQFTRRYGQPQSDGSYQLLSSWQSALTNGALVGSWRDGDIALIIFIFVPFFSPSVGILVVGEVLCGISWGAFQAITTTYAADVCPVPLRAYLTTYVNLCFVMGQLLSSGVLRAFIQLNDEWAYRIPFGLQWMWPVPILIGCWLAPESPWWLVRHGLQEEAKSVLLQLRSGPSSEKETEVSYTLAMIIYTNEVERLEKEGTSYKECFQTSNLRRTEIACMAYASQMICGSSLMGYSVYFYQQAGLPTVQALNLSIGQFAIGFVGTMLSWWLMSMFGRRTLYLTGTSISVVLLLAMGAVGIPKQVEATAWAAGSCLLLHRCGDTIYSTRLRAKTVVLARCVYNICGIICNILTPRMINPSAWNWAAKSGFFWAGVAICCLAWMFFRLPEAKGRTYAELDILFEQKTPTRLFANTRVTHLERGIADGPTKEDTEAN